MGQWQASLISQLEQLPGISYCVRIRGWPFILCWAHRVTGIILVIYLIVHVYTLSSLVEPKVFAAKMSFYKSAFFSFLEWTIAIPLVFHAFNGARVIFYEIFHVRDDSAMIRWVAALGMTFILTLGYFMVKGDQQVSVVFFWLTTFIITCIAGYIVYVKVSRTGNQNLWKLQRISGALLLPLLSAHMLFMHMNYLVGHDVDAITLRMQNYFMKGIDIILVTFIIFHAAYGLCSIISDYVEKNLFRRLLASVMVVVMLICGWAGVRLIVTI